MHRLELFKALLAANFAISNTFDTTEQTELSVQSTEKNSDFPMTDFPSYYCGAQNWVHRYFLWISMPPEPLKCKKKHFPMLFATFALLWNVIQVLFYCFDYLNTYVYIYVHKYERCCPALRAPRNCTCLSEIISSRWSGCVGFEMCFVGVSF